MKNPLRTGLLLRAMAGLAFIASSGTSLAAGMDCEKAGTFVEREICADEGLRELDRQLNVLYSGLPYWSPEKRSALQQEQRSWLRQVRDACTTTACLKTSYESRLRELSLMYRAPMSSRPAPEPAARNPASETGEPKAVTVYNVPAAPDSAYEVASIESHQSGRWYFEVTVDKRYVPEAMEALLLVGVRGLRDTQVTGPAIVIRPTNLAVTAPDGGGVVIVGGKTDEPAVNRDIIGVAVDLDTGFMALGHRVPGQRWDPRLSDSGTALPKREQYRAGVLSSVGIQNLIERGALTVNFGRQPLSGTIPVGYSLFDMPLNVPLKMDSPFLLPFTPTAGRTTDFWIESYWRWTRSFPENLLPHLDSTGERCAEAQHGEMWFLTGSNEGRPVRRRCVVPSRKYLLVPIINTLAKSEVMGCEGVAPMLDGGRGEAVDLRFLLDGKALPEPQAYYAKSNCFEIAPRSGGSPYRAISDGYWVFLQPLPPGKHEIRFGGRIRADGFTQDITYLLDVQ